jgi:hypothetical protein
VVSALGSETATLQLLPTVPLPDLKASSSVALKSESVTPAVSVTLVPIKDTLEVGKETPLNLSTTPPQVCNKRQLFGLEVVCQRSFVNNIFLDSWSWRIKWSECHHNRLNLKTKLA